MQLQHPSNARAIQEQYTSITLAIQQQFTGKTIARQWQYRSNTLAIQQKFNSNTTATQQRYNSHTIARHWLLIRFQFTCYLVCLDSSMIQFVLFSHSFEFYCCFDLWHVMLL